MYEPSLPSTSPLLELIISILGCNACSPTTALLAVERDSGTEPVFGRKRHNLLRGAWQGPGVRAVAPSPASRPHSLSGGYMQCKGHGVMCHAMQHFRFLHQGCSRTVHNSAVTDEDGSMQRCQACSVCTAPRIQLADSSLYIDIYTVHDLPCKCMMELHGGITLLKIRGIIVIYCRHWLLLEHSTVDDIITKTNIVQTSTA